MRIDAYNKISQIYGTNKISKLKKTDKSSFRDKLELSRTGNDYNIAKQIVAQTPDVREDKINDIKQRLESGTYNVKMEEVAEKLVNRYFDELI